ncbi:hypothetical protein AAFC00_004781 [Neodothiora populina]|uniref:Uncharacterized protein n=1 Tax=Neodothiora populina TaxID=2781224 RepID=A0ABR3P4K2_9PEZI
MTTASPSTKARSEVLFTLPIEVLLAPGAAGKVAEGAKKENSSNSNSPGRVVCYRPAHRVYVLEFSAGPDNRLTTPFCQALLTALDIIETKYQPGVLITTSGIPKFYSNGLDLEHATFTPGFWSQTLYALWKRLLTCPMPTIALMNGHCFAGALMLAMYHDYRIMNPHRGYVCLNEVELGVPLSAAMSSVFRQKCSPQTYRTLLLEARRYKALEALKEGIIDSTGGWTRRWRLSMR